jgi:Zn-dependent M16 (insulinase) family peptidase
MSTQVSSSLNNVGDSYRGFYLTKHQVIDEIHSSLTELTHEKSGAKILHIGNDDPENVFCFSFRTLPNDSTGVAHILEHTVLCGSKRFPISDPFFAMIRRSLNTFMNAFTGADFTCYPAASQVEKDFYNLFTVYHDAVFQPLLKELSFRQEGHRLEFEDPNDKTTPLGYKGIVYNEMKGAMCTAYSRISETLHQTLLPDLTYSFNSGGAPEVIPDLTHEELLKFHQQYYHPSRCLYYFYGSFPLTKHLDALLDHGLDSVEKLEEIPPIPKQKRFSTPKTCEEYYPISEDEDAAENTYITFAWLTCSILDYETSLALTILGTAIMDTDASPLKVALLRSKLCKEASASLDDEMSEIPFVITLRGCEAENVDTLEALLNATLKKICDEGIDPNLIESALHQLEFQRTEILNDGMPYGLSLFLRAAILQQHGAKPEEALKIHTLFDGFRQHLKDNPSYLLDLLKKYFIDNTHRVRIVTHPDKELNKREEAEEKTKLQKTEAALNEEMKDEIVKKTQELEAFQEKQQTEDISVLPKIHLEDVPKKTRDFALKQGILDQYPTFHHDVFTNQILYTELDLDLPQFEKSELPALSLFSSLIPQLGIGGRSYEETLEYIEEHTGGVWTSLSMNYDSQDHLKYAPKLTIKGKALDRKADKLFPFIKDLLSDVNFRDKERIHELIKKYYSSLTSSLNSNALRYAMSLSASQVTPAANILYQWNGLEFYWLIKDLHDNFDSRIDAFIASCEDFQKRCLGVTNTDIIIGCDSTMMQKIQANNAWGLNDLQLNSPSPWEGNLSPTSVESHGRIISAPVAFSAVSFPTVSYSDPASSRLLLASFIFDNRTLHPQIREKGGAYGGGSSLNPMSGTFNFYAYRDPNIVSSFNAFEKAVENVLAGKFTNDHLEEAKFEVVQAFDNPISPGSRAPIAYSWHKTGKNFEIRQQYRERALSATKEDIIEAVKTCIVPNMQKGAKVSFAGKELLEKENEKFKGQGKEILTPHKV